MAIKDWSDNGSADYGDPTVQDLSAMPENQGFPGYGASESGGNTISATPSMGAPGTDSEGAPDLAYNNANIIDGSTSFDGSNNRVEH